MTIQLLAQNVLPAQTFQQRLVVNVEGMLKSGSTYVVAVFIALAGLYQALPESTQLALVNSFPILKGYGPVLTFGLTWLVTRLKPSNTLTGQAKTLVEEVARLRFNDLLRSRGLDPATVDPAAPAFAPTMIAPAPVPDIDPALLQKAAEVQAVLAILRSQRITPDVMLP